MQREEPYLGLTCSRRSQRWGFPSGRVHRWCMVVVSSCREMGLSPATSATLAPCCQRIVPGTHGGPPGLTRRKVGMTSDHHAPYVQGFTHATMAGTTGCDAATRSGSLKTGLSSDRSLQLDCVKAESLVIANQQRRGECVPGPCTHRPSSHESGQHPKPVA